MKKIHVATYKRDIHKGIPVAEQLKRDLPDFGIGVVIRLGGSMPYKDYEIHVNSAQSVKNSINKLTQKRLLLAAGVPTQPLILEENVFPAVVKAITRSGGLSVYVVNTPAERENAVAAIGMGGYLVEPLFNTTSEYRLHCCRKEVFFSVKKHKRNKEDIIITRDNHFNKMEFLKPRLWKEMQAACVKAMTALDLDIACFDVLYDSSGAEHKFVISEANTNPELLLNTYNAYVKKLEEIIRAKIADRQLKPAAPVAKAEPVIYVEPVKKRDFKLTDSDKVDVFDKILSGKYAYNAETKSIEIKL